MQGFALSIREDGIESFTPLFGDRLVRISLALHERHHFASLDLARRELRPELSHLGHYLRALLDRLRKHRVQRGELLFGELEAFTTLHDRFDALAATGSLVATPAVGALGRYIVGADRDQRAQGENSTCRQFHARTLLFHPWSWTNPLVPSYQSSGWWERSLKRRARRERVAHDPGPVRQRVLEVAGLL